MTVEELRALLADLPDYMEVFWGPFEREVTQLQVVQTCSAAGESDPTPKVVIR